MKFTSLLKQVILEQTKLDYIISDFLEPKVDKEGKKQKALLTKKEFSELLQADPTTKMNNVDIMTASKEDLKRVSPGKYVRWIIKHYLKPETERNPGDRGYENEISQAKSVYLEDLSKITNDIKKYVRFKHRIEGQRDISHMTPSELYNAVKDFSLEKTKASKTEKQEAAKTFQHPGAEIVFRGDKWTVAKISDKGQLGKDAACFYGGYYLEPSQGETRWCTSSPGLSWFDRYIKDGPLYVVIPNESEKFGTKSGLPANRYQFHFPSNQFMDVHDHSINLIDFLNGQMSELKEYFKPEFAKGLTVGGEKLVIESFSHGAIGKFIALYGLDDLIDNLPDSLKEFQIQNRDKNDIIIKIPDSIGRFKNLHMILLDNCIDSLPDSICQLDKLRFLACINNKNLTRIPECIGDLPSLLFLNFKGSPNVQVPQSIIDRATDYGDNMYDLQD